MQRNTTLPANNDPNSIYSPQGQNTQNFQTNMNQNQANMTPFNPDMQNMQGMQFQNVNQQALNNYNLNSLNQLAMRNRIQNLNSMNANNLNAMGMVNFNQINMMNLMNNMNVPTAVMNNNSNLPPNNNKNWNMNLNSANNNNPTMNYSNMSIPNIPSLNNSTDTINNNSLNSINMNNLQNPTFNNNFNVSQSQINYMQPQTMNYMNYNMHQNPLNNNLRNEKNDSNSLINQAIKSQLAVRDMQNQAKLYASQRIHQVKNETPKLNVGNFNTQPTAYPNQIKEESNLNTPTLPPIPNNKLNSTMNIPPMMKFNDKPPIIQPIIQPNIKVELAEDAIRYDTSEHLQKRVAYYRYKDLKYQDLVMQQGVLNQKLYLERTKKNDNHLKFNTIKNPYIKNDRLPSTVVYDADDGPVFFRNVMKLHNTLKEIANKEEILVPIRLDLEIAGQRLCDTFTWNLNDQFISVELFVETLLKDLHLSNQAFFHPVTAAIKEQLKDYSMHGLHILNKLKHIKNEIDNQNELRIVIKLDITLGRVSLEDQFEWDILNLENSPEKFATYLADDLGLGGEFKTAIAHSIREQIYSFHKSLSIIRYNFDGEVNDVNLVHSFLPVVNHTIRDKSNTDSFTPILVEISEAELQRQAKIQERENRRTRRQQRAGRRGAILPEREPIRTTRTIMKSNIEFLSTTFPHGDANALGGRAIKRSKDSMGNLNVKRSHIGNNEVVNINQDENHDAAADSNVD